MAGRGTIISSRAALRNAGVGEIVQVQGGHIVRSTGRKDRHSKVCTAKGPRDRRVRLSAHTAIQFYDVQDRLGYDRPSKAVDWLIKKAKSAIDELDELPAWKPATADAIIVRQREGRSSPGVEEDDTAADGAAGESSRVALTSGERSGGMYVVNYADNSSLLPPSMDSDSIADTIKSSFPIGGASSATQGEVDGEVSPVAATTNPVASSPVEGGVQSMQFQSYPLQDLLCRRSASGQSQDLKLSLQSFQDPAVFQPQHRPQHSSLHNHHHHDLEEAQRQSLFEGANPIGFENPSAGWAVNQQAEMGRFQRLGGWNLAGCFGDCSNGGFILMPPQQAQQQLLQPLFGHGVGGGRGIGHRNSNNYNDAVGATTSHLFSQRGPLQSSNTPLVRAWMGESWMANAAATSGRGSNRHNDDDHQPVSIHPPSLPGIGLTSSGGFSGFHIPARIQGSGEEYDGNLNKPSSASSGSHH